MELIIIKGQRDSGKTMTATMLHNELVKRSSGVKLLKTSGNYLSVGYHHEDFCSVIDLHGKSVAIISAGDDASSLKEGMERLINEYKPDIFVVCTRTRDRVGSSYRMLEENYGNLLKKENVFETVWTENIADAESAKQNVVNEIVKRIEQILKTI